MLTSCRHPRARSESGTVLFLATTGLVIVCYAGAVAGLWQWGQREWWTRFDCFTTGVLLLTGLLVAQHIRFYRRLPSPHETAGEAFGTTYDPAMGRWNGLILLAELSAVVDYGQWRLTPRLEQAWLQTTGLVVFAAAVLLVVWADKHLLDHFVQPGRRDVITGGPYHWVRHPRYLGLFLTRIGYAMVFASVLAWILVPAWAVVVLRRVRIEEAHLQETFGDRYRDYARSTPGLLPGSMPAARARR
jgi:protein-S-isoprenylcysteine O-methyltransferase Ste14